MNWISNYVRPRINSIFSRREVPENLWTKCDECGQMLNVMRSSSKGSDRPQSFGRPAGDMRIGRAGVGESRRDDHAGCC